MKEVSLETPTIRDLVTTYLIYSSKPFFKGFSFSFVSSVCLTLSSDIGLYLTL